MPDNATDILGELERLASYDGAWRLLREEGALLRERVGELLEREAQRSDVLVIALAGGSGVGKSTLLNALAGDKLAPTSEFRPCTAAPAVYHPPGVKLDFAGWKTISGSALENLVIIDTPDSDTIVREHRQRVIEVLGKCDLVMLCGSPDKYLDEATWALLRPLQGERSLICVETKAECADGIREHWLARLEEQGFKAAAYFRVNALRTLDRKISGQPAIAEEFDFPGLEQFLNEELNVERIARIKSSNAIGLLTKTVSQLDARVACAAPELAQLETRLKASGQLLCREALEAVERRLFTESHLWNFAMGRELGLRAKGIVGTLYRILEALRTMPARLAGWMPWSAGPAALGRKAASLLSTRESMEDELHVATRDVLDAYRRRQSEVAYALSRAGFDLPDAAAGLDPFRDAVNRRVAAVLRGPARDAVVSSAHLFTNWPAALAADALPILFILYAGWRIVTSFFGTAPLPLGFISHASAVLVILLAFELFVISLLARGLAWYAREHALNVLRASLQTPELAFAAERKLIEEARTNIEAIARLKRAVFDE